MARWVDFRSFIAAVLAPAERAIGYRTDWRWPMRCYHDVRADGPVDGR
jgi:hypothetical protein